MDKSKEVEVWQKIAAAVERKIALFSEYTVQIGSESIDAKVEIDNDGDFVVKVWNETDYAPVFYIASPGLREDVDDDEIEAIAGALMFPIMTSLLVAMTGHRVMDALTIGWAIMAAVTDKTVEKPLTSMVELFKTMSIGAFEIMLNRWKGVGGKTDYLN